VVTEDQSEVISFLASPSTHGGAAVERIETHASIVFLAGRRAWKLKRAVRYDYLDFSTPERRRFMCEADVRGNRRIAPALYQGVVPVTREGNGSLALGGAGSAVDWVIEMRRFDQAALFDRLAAQGALDLEWMRPLAAAIARFHDVAARRPDHGGASGIAWVIDGNADAFAGDLAPLLDAATASRVIAESRRILAQQQSRLDRRRADGFVRDCHGDLHLRNIVLLDGQPTLFDGVEFNDEIACIDVMYDLAFLLMDLWRRELRSHANAVLNGYLSETHDFDGVGLLPLFLSCRAAVRAKTSATAANLQSDGGQRGELEQLARAYLRLAEHLLQPSGPVLIAVGGFSGTGKSTLAYALAPVIGAVPGAVVLRSDEIRKELCGVPAVKRLGPDGYRPDVTRRVYTTMAERATHLLETGHSVIADAVHARSTDRDAIERVACAVSAPFVGIWLDAPEPILRDRLGQRSVDASDADAIVLQAQLATGAGRITWHRIDAAGPTDIVLQSARALCDAASHELET